MVALRVLWMDSSGGSQKRAKLSDVPVAAPATDEPGLFAAMVERTEGRVYAFLRRWSFDHETAEDLRQETFSKAWKGRGTFDTSRSELNWILTIARNIAIDFVREQNAQRRGNPIRLLDRFGDDGKDSDSSGDELVDKRLPGPLVRLVQLEAIEKLNAAIEQLDDNDRELLSLHQAGFSYDTIAEMTGRSNSAIGPALTRMRQQLARVLKDYKHIELWHMPDSTEEDNRDSA